MITLDNGAMVLEVRFLRENQAIVLAQTLREYVTWNVDTLDGQTWYAYNGHYPAPGDLSEDAYLLALEDFHRR